MAQESWVVEPGQSRVIDLERVRRVKAGFIGGRVNVIAHDEPGARVEVHDVTGRGLKISLEGDTLEVDHPRVRWENFLDVFRNLAPGSASAEVSILVPRGTPVTLGVVSAQALVAGIHANVSLNTVSGELQAESLRGRLDVNAVGGEVSVSDHAGPITAHVINGDVTASGAVTRFTVDSVTADVFLDLTGPVEKITTNSVSGNLTVRLDAERGARYTMNSASGSLQIDGQLIQSMRGRGYTGGREGEATQPAHTIEIAANTMTGNIVVLRRGEGSPAPHAPASAAAPAAAASAADAAHPAPAADGDPS